MLQDAEVCDAQVYDTTRAPLDIYMMIDDSASMLPWWAPTLDSIDKFFQDPASAGVGVGLQFFGTMCDPAFYATPAVPIAPLPLNAAPLRQAFPLIPLDETATLPALRGAITHARDWATQHPDRKVVVLLVTDGIPEECDSTLENVAQAAREGFEGKPSIQTYVVGIGDVTAIDQFAQAGGTGRALVAPGGDSSELTRALNQIRGAALPCEFGLPSAGGPTLQADRVNLRHTNVSGQAMTIGAVSDVAHCDAVRGGWYFDDRAAPRRVIACPQSCEQLNAGGAVKLLLGCPTIDVVPS